MRVARAVRRRASCSFACSRFTSCRRPSSAARARCSRSRRPTSTPLSDTQRQAHRRPGRRLYSAAPEYGGDTVEPLDPRAPALCGAPAPPHGQTDARRPAAIPSGSTPPKREQMKTGAARIRCPSNGSRRRRTTRSRTRAAARRCSRRPASQRLSRDARLAHAARARWRSSARACTSIPAPTGYATPRAVQCLSTSCPPRWRCSTASIFFHEVLGIALVSPAIRSVASAERDARRRRAHESRIKWIENVELRRRIRERPRARHGRRAGRRRPQPRPAPDGNRADRHRRLHGLRRRAHPAAKRARR